MNIYITKENEKRLRKITTEHPDKTMSGLINNLLNKYWAGKGPDIFPEYAKEVSAVIKTPIDAKKAIEKIIPKEHQTYFKKGKK